MQDREYTQTLEPVRFVVKFTARFRMWNVVLPLAFQWVHNFNGFK